MATGLARTLMGFWLLIVGCSAWADMEIIPLRHRTVEQVLPVLRPLVEPGGALSGMNDQLVIRASSANIAQLRKVLESIDVVQRRLIISVRQDAGGASSERGAAVGGTVGESRVDQRIQALEGTPALIQIGQSVPMTNRTVTRGPGGAIVTESVAYRDATVGFEVVPRVAGDRVILDIRPWRDAPGAGGSISVQHMASTASGRLGVWFELGASSQDESRQSGGPFAGTSALRQDLRRVWVKVEEIR